MLNKIIWGGVIAVIVGLGCYAIYAVFDSVTGEKKSVLDETRKIYEQGYFEGQRDAVSGDVRIRMVDNRTWVWQRSPYNDTTKPFKDTLRTLGMYK